MVICRRARADSTAPNISKASIWKMKDSRSSKATFSKAPRAIEGTPYCLLRRDVISSSFTYASLIRLKPSFPPLAF
mgnify:CR=1 FL=1